MYATKYTIYYKKEGGVIELSFHCMCPHCGQWVGIDKPQTDQAHQCPFCNKVFIETPQVCNRDVFMF